MRGSEMKSNDKYNEKFNFWFFARVAAFSLIFVLALTLLSVGPFSKKEGTQFHNYYKDAYSFMIEPQNTIDIVCIGTSEPYSGYVPHKVYEKYGYTSVNTCMTNQDTVRSYAFFKDLLNYQKPKVLIIETDMLDYEKDNAAVSAVYKKLQSTFAPVSEKRFNDILSSRLSVFQFNDRWKSLNFKTAFSSYDKNKQYQSINHGYSYSKDVDPTVKENEKMRVTDKTAGISEECLYYLDGLIALCNENDVKYFFVEMPQNGWNYAKHNAVTELAEKYDCDFIDYNLRMDEIGFDIKTDFRDPGHTNYSGAVKVTQGLADYMHENYSDILCDHRGDSNYAFYDKSISEFYELNNIKQTE